MSGLIALFVSTQLEEFLCCSQDSGNVRWLGLATQVQCRQWDPRGGSGGSADPCNWVDAGKYERILLEARAPTTTSEDSILCIGQPDRDDLESISSRLIKYDLMARWHDI